MSTPSWRRPVNFLKIAAVLKRIPLRIEKYAAMANDVRVEPYVHTTCP